VSKPIESPVTKITEITRTLKDECQKTKQRIQEAARTKRQGLLSARMNRSSTVAALKQLYLNDMKIGNGKNTSLQ